MTVGDRPLGWLARGFWRVAFAVHAATAAAGLWLMPGGFPLAHPRFWANRVLPAAVLVGACVGLLATWRRKQRLVSAVGLAFCALWLAGAASFALTFPVSWRLPCIFCLAVGVALLGAFHLAAGGRRVPRAAAAVAAVLGAVVGAAAPRTQRAGPPSARPANVGLPAAAIGEDLSARVPPVLRWGSCSVFPEVAMVSVAHGGLEVDVRPLLTFRSVSPDRCWTILAPQRWWRRKRWRATACSTSSTGGVSLR